MPKQVTPLDMLASVIVMVLGMAYVVIMEMTGKHSLFPQSLDAQPLFWWPLIFWPAALGLGVWAVGSLLLMPRFPRHRTGRLVLSVGIVLFLTALATDKVGGVAIYPDRVVVRDLNRFSLGSTVYTAEDVREVRLRCDKTTRYVRKGSRHNLDTVLDYRLMLSDGRELNLAKGAYGREVYSEWLRAMVSLEETLSREGIPRRVTLSAHESLQTYKQCVDMFRMDFSPTQSEVYLRLMAPGM